MLDHRNETGIDHTVTLVSSVRILNDSCDVLDEVRVYRIDSELHEFIIDEDIRVQIDRPFVGCTDDLVGG